MRNNALHQDWTFYNFFVLSSLFQEKKITDYDEDNRKNGREINYLEKILRRSPIHRNKSTCRSLFIFS